MIPSDPHWRRAPVGAGRLHPWLIDRGSLTARLAARCDALAVDVLFQGLRRVHRDERWLLPSAGRALVREVCLRCGTRPVVYAHSIVAARDLRGPWRSVAGLGSRPLGAALFADHRVTRYPLHQRKLRAGHELFERAADLLSARPVELWARRSIFALRGSPILVTEVFLPGILKL